MNANLHANVTLILGTSRLGRGDTSIDLLGISDHILRRMIVSMYMSEGVEIIGPAASPRDAIGTMRKKGIRRLVVTQAEEVVGMVCHRDLTRAAERLGTNKQVAKLSEIMKAPVITVSQDEPIENAARLMTRHHIGSLVVLHAGKLVGIITESDIFRAFTYLLTGHGNSARITFDITKGDDVLDYLVMKTRGMDLKLRSFLTFQDGERLMAVARIRGDRLKEMVDELWDSGHLVVNVVYLD